MPASLTALTWGRWCIFMNPICEYKIINKSNIFFFSKSEFIHTCCMEILMVLWDTEITLNTYCLCPSVVNNDSLIAWIHKRGNCNLLGSGSLLICYSYGNWCRGRQQFLSVKPGLVNWLWSLFSYYSVTKVEGVPAVCLTGYVLVELLNEQRAFDLTKCLSLCNVLCSPNVIWW